MSMDTVKTKFFVDYQAGKEERSINKDIDILPVL